MSINLDEIIAGASSVEDVVKALVGEQQNTQKAADQLLQLAGAAQGSMSPMQWLKNKVSPGSTAGTLASEGDYKKHVIEAQENGEAPMSREEFNRMRQKMQDGSDKSNFNGKARG